MTDSCFTCPTDESYAGVSLQLQATAQQTESCLLPLERLLRGAVNLPTIVTQTTGATNLALNSNIQVIDEGTPTILFSNTAFASVTSNNAVTETGDGGLWLAGINFTVTASGAVTAGSYRQVATVSRTSVNAASGPNKFDTLGVTVFEANNGNGMDINVVSLLPLDKGDVIKFTIRNNNASFLTIASGARFWATRISNRTTTAVL